jgi:hypothetical protein
MSHKRTDCMEISAELYIFFNVHVITAQFFYHCFFVLLLFCLANDNLLLSDICRVIQEELPPLMELFSEEILSKKCHINLGPILNIYRVTFVIGNALLWTARGLLARIMHATTEIRDNSVNLRKATCAVHKRADKCIEAEGGIFENVL